MKPCIGMNLAEILNELGREGTKGCNCIKVDPRHVSPTVSSSAYLSGELSLANNS